MHHSLEGFLEQIDAPERSLAVGGDVPEPIERLLADLFDEQSVAVTRADVPEAADKEGAVVLIEDGEVVSSSPVDALLETILLVNSDLYVTGARELEDVDLPSVLAELDETLFRLRGYPASNKEKLLLITVSRLIERAAFEANAGTLRSSFQRLSRLDDESGTREVYEKLGGRDADVHVYGIPDDPPTDLDLTVHGGESTEYRHSWFVVFRPPDPTAEHVALVAVERGDDVWDGFWTYDPELVRDVDEYIRNRL